jgi:type III secretion system FlhB-like substrate exporter
MPGDTITYSITTGNDDGLFVIDATTGIITLATGKALDYETATSHTLTVTATDADGLADTAQVVVTVTNIDEGAATFTITGTPKVGDVLTAEKATDDADGNGSGGFTYQWFVDVSGAKTDINGATSATYTPEAADVGKNIGVRVTYTDAGGNAESVEVVTDDVVLTDVVPNTAPVITSNHNAAVDLAEDTAAGETIAAVTATDTDSDTLTYAITAGDDDGLFAIDASGNIALATGKAVDFETAPNSYTLTVEVSDGNGGTDTVDVTINVVNVNEAPVITAAGTGTVAENADGADTGITLTVADEDSGDSIASWAIVNGAGIDMSSLFEVVTASGGGYKLKLVSGQSLNHEDAASHTLTITATDSGGLTHAVEVTVAVTDVNEAPSIVAAGTGTVVENVAGAETGITFTVADPDDSDSISAWAITDADGNDMSATFEVVPASGSGYMLKLKSGVTLDYATASSYALKITAMDAGTGNLASNVVDVTVAVTTIPVFADATASFDLAEDAAADAVVGTVTATDADGAPALTYSLIAGALTVFRIDSSTGAISVLNADALDYETATTYSLTVQVSDGTNTDTIAVTINLTDVNDNAPVFTEASYAASVAENIAAGATIATVAANDVDTVGTLQYRITAGNADGLFAIDATTGVITLASGKALDYETATSHLIGVEVSDGTNTHTARVVVTVTDINEAAPVFDAASYTATVNENAGADAVVTTVSATDADAGAVLTYRIVSGNDGAVGDAFTIDSKTGEISIVDPDDLDIQGGAPEQYTLTVEVSDGTNTATVQVTIDVNAAPIVVISPRAGDGVVAEDTLGAETGISVRFILDGGATLNIANARVTGRGGDKFELVADSDNPGFYVVKLKDDQQLSYGDDLRGLRIEATDSNGNVSNLSTRFNVSVNDVAEFDFASGSEAKVGVALTVEKTADDADGNGTGGFSYQWYVDDAGTKTDIAGATSASFTPTSAQEGKTIGVRITYTDAENRTESVEETFTTAVAAADPVNVAPVFAVSEYTATVAESLTAGVAIATVVATDADAGDTLGYAIVSGDADGLFVIDANGVITLASGKALDYETATRHTLTVEVDDGAGGKATTTVVITVTDANEAPVITATGTGTVDENAAGADTGITLSIADEDAGDSITFAITGTGSDKFEVVAIDASDLSKGYTLKLKSGVSLDFEDAAPYTLTITVTDGGDLTDTVDVTVGVNNQDDGLAIVGIRASRGDLDALAIGDTLAASITTADPDGVANGTTGTWRWFHKHNPDATIGTGDSYTLTEADRGAKIGVEYTYSDVVDAANSTTSKAIAILETELARVVVTPAAPAEDTDITLGDTDNDPQTPDVGSKVDAGDGSDTITGGAGNDEITGGKGDDKIDLGASDTDTDVVIYGIGGQSAKDGGDNISNFNRGVDQFVFSLDSNQAEVSDVSDYDSFIDYITKGTATLDDDEFRVQLDLGKDAVIKHKSKACSSILPAHHFTAVVGHPCH